MNLAIGVVKFKSLGGAYAALNLSSRDSDLEVLELSPLGTEAQILVRAEAARTWGFINQLRTGEIERSWVIESYDPHILNAYFSLEHASIENFVVIYESDFCGDLFDVAHKTLPFGHKVVDFRVQRITGSPSYLIMTGATLAPSREIIDAIKRTRIKVSVIPEAFDGLKRYFDFEPKSI